MGDGVTDDKDMVIKIGDQEAGTTSGQLIIDEIEVSGQRDNTQYHGIGNETAQGLGYGNQEYSISGTTILNGAAADLALSITGDETVSGVVRTPNMALNCGKLDWNDFDISASDDGDVTFSVEMDVRDYERTAR